MTSPKVVIVTGANRGIGLAICETILRSHSPVKLYACSRAGKDLGFAIKASNSQIKYPKLDVTKGSDIHDFASNIKSNDGHVDVLINNAGYNNTQTSDPEELGRIVRTNYFGTQAMCQAILPQMGKNGRIVNLSSIASTERLYDRDVEAKVRDPDITVDQVTKLAEEYLSLAESGKLGNSGRGTAYKLSKACVNGLTNALARDHPELVVNCCCPGWVSTDMGNLVGSAPKSPTDGAKIPVKLGFADVEGVSGKYWSNPGVSDTGSGQVMSW